MSIFLIKQNKLEKLKEISFQNEREMQRIIELNLGVIFGLDFVKSEVALGDLRIDTLAFDNESKSFVIIEYKKDVNFSVIDQGYAYLGLLLNNKADFILEYSECKKKSLKREDVDWSQSKTIFISPQFTKYQRQAINFKDLPIELWEISRFENNTILFNQLKSPESSESITKISHKSEIVQRVSREIKLYTEEFHTEGISEAIKEMYGKIREKILELGEDIEIRPRKKYIGFISSTNFVDIRPKKSMLKIWLNVKKGELDDPKKIARDISNIGHHGNGDYEITLKPGQELDDIMILIKQSYKLHSS